MAGIERLTARWVDGIYETFDPIDLVDNEYTGTNYKKVLKKLGEYEDLEERGALLRLPCKVGDVAYYVHREYLKGVDKWVHVIDEVEVDSFVMNTKLLVNVSLYIGGDRFAKTLTPYKTLFFTKAEAEAALERMK